MLCSQQPTNPKLGNALGVLTKPRAERPRISSFISGRNKRICIIQGSKTALRHKQLRIWSELEGDLPADTDKILNSAVANISHIQFARNIFLNEISFVVICSCQLLVLTHSFTHSLTHSHYQNVHSPYYNEGYIVNSGDDTWKFQCFVFSTSTNVTPSSQKTNTHFTVQIKLRSFR